MAQHKEHALQRAVMRLLDRALPHDAMVTAINPLPGGSAKSGAQAKQLGLAAGIPDLLIVHHGHSLWIELKSEKGKLSEAQKTVHILLNVAHRYDRVTKTGSVVVCRSVDEVLQELKIHKMTLREAA